jgi:hypothetical protein
MATMTHRRTFALDESTTTRIRRLAALWNVSQTEVIRRAVANAETPASKPDPLALLRQLHDSGGGLTQASALSYLSKVRTDRKKWRSQ